jgi:predicted nucleotidyltransferase component of viral defense system
MRILNRETYLGIKGGTALMFFYDLSRSSVDLDFNLLNVSQLNMVYKKVHYSKREKSPQGVK